MASKIWQQAGVLAALTLAGCGNGIPEPESVQQAITLEGFGDCAGLEQYLEDRAVLAMKADLTARAETNGDWIGFGFPGRAMNDASPTAAMEASGGKSSATPTGPSEFTTTNTQVAGVDEADFVKNDGTHILVLSGQTLLVNKSWPADQLATVSKLAIEGWPREMFLDEKSRVVVFSQVYRAYEWAAQEYYCQEGLGRGECDHDFSNTLKLTVVDLADDTDPQVVREEYLPGTYLSSRRVGAAVRVVTSDPFRWPAGIRFTPEGSEAVFRDKALRVKAFEALMDENETLIRAQGLDQWLPAGVRKLPDGTTISVPYVCADFLRPSGATELGVLTVATLNLDDATAPVERTSVLARADEVYASASGLYVANHHWWWWPRMGQQNFTYLHKFDITSPGKAVYLASGAVEGHIVDQFSMDEHQGYLRVAATRAERVADSESWFGSWQTSSRVAVLAERDGALQLVGKTDDLAAGERLYSSRFMGERGFLVTFRQTDPLFSLDLSDPSNPKQIGELKVPGFSTYLHPIDPGHLLAIGSDSGMVKLSLFDVSDLVQPKELFTRQVGTYSGSSEAQYEHKAFNYFPAKKLLAIPFYDWSPQSYGSDYIWSSFVSDLRVFRVDPGTGIDEVGAIEMTDVFSRGGGGYYGWSWYWNPGVRRSVMADDFVYAVSDGGIRSANVNALASPLKTVLFDQPNL